MDVKKIGIFLKEIRKEKGLTQEQLAEMLGVSGRTVSRWETGTNMPDLSILIQLAEYYEVEIKEILDGERKSGNMDEKLKETLTKVADYSELQKAKARKAGSTAFGVMFAVCAVIIIIQMVMTTNLQLVAGETAVLLLGGIAYIAIMVQNGVWETGSRFVSTPGRDAFISIICSAIFSVILAVCLLQKAADKEQIIKFSLVFFAGISIVGFIVLRLLAWGNKKRQSKGS